MKRISVLLLFILSVSYYAIAQEDDILNQVSVGVEGGWHTNAMRFSALDKSYYPDRRNLNSGVFTVFGQYDFGRDAICCQAEVRISSQRRRIEQYRNANRRLFRRYH